METVLPFEDGVVATVQGWWDLASVLEQSSLRPNRRG